MSKIKGFLAKFIILVMLMFFLAQGWVWASSLLPLPEGVKPNLSENIQRQPQAGEPGYESPTALPSGEKPDDLPVPTVTEEVKTTPVDPTIGKLKRLKWPAVIAMCLVGMAGVGVFLHQHKEKKKIL